MMLINHNIRLYIVGTYYIITVKLHSVQSIYPAEAVYIYTTIHV